MLEMEPHIPLSSSI